MSFRYFSTCGSLLQKKPPGFLRTALAAAEPALTKPEPINRPFGFEEQVILGQKKTSIMNFFSEEAREKRQRQLDHDITHSSFYEFKSFNNTKGKIFSPPVSYFKKDKSKFFPNFKAYSLSKRNRNLYDILKEKVTILRIYSTISGEKCANSHIEQYLSEDGYQNFLEKFPRAQVVDLNIPQSWAKGLLAGFSKGNLRKTIAPARHDNYFLIPHNLFDVDSKKVLKCDNTCSGYIYILDGDGRIRWATSGNANEKESEILWKSIRGISKEIASNETKA